MGYHHMGNSYVIMRTLKVVGLNQMFVSVVRCVVLPSGLMFLFIKCGW